MAFTLQRDYALKPEITFCVRGIISPLLSNIYLDPLDWLMVEHGVEMVRYADDAVILCRSEVEAKAALEKVQQWVEKAGLALHPAENTDRRCQPARRVRLPGLPLRARSEMAT